MFKKVQSKRLDFSPILLNPVFKSEINSLRMHYLSVCYFSDPEIGTAVLFIKAEETKQQINKLNSEVQDFLSLDILEW